MSSLNEDIRFLCIYIREAHAADVWPIDGPVVQEPRSSEARVAVAQDFARACGLEWTVLVDEVEDAFLREFSPWPFRLYVLRGDRLQVKTMPVDGTSAGATTWLKPDVSFWKEATPASSAIVALV